MKRNDLILKERQRYLFELIQAKIPEGQKLCSAVETALNINRDAAYRRMKGTKYLGFEEIYTLCHKFDVSMDEVLGRSSGQGTYFKYSVVNPAVNGSYIRYLQQLCEMFKGLSDVNGEFVYTAFDIPFYYFPDYPELMYFMLYDRASVLNSRNISYKDFCSQMDKDSIMPLYRQTADAYMKVQSTEIWDAGTISGILHSLKYCAQTKCFENNETALLLKQLSELIDAVEKDACEGERANGKAPFCLYRSTADITHNIMLISKGGKFNCDIRLFTASSLITNDSNVCSTVHKEMDDLISKSILISTKLKHERCLFFQNMQNEIASLRSELKIL